MRADRGVSVIKLVQGAEFAVGVPPATGQGFKLGHFGGIYIVIGALGEHWLQLLVTADFPLPVSGFVDELVVIESQ